MVFLDAYIILLLLGKLTSAQWLKPQTAEEDKPSNTSQPRITIPNPYPMPNSPYSIDFGDPGTLVRPDEVQRFLDHALDDLVTHIQTHGDAPLPIWWGDVHCYQFDYSHYKFEVNSVENNGLTYNDTIQILVAFSLKSRLEGYRERVADVFDTLTGEFKGDAIFTRNGFENASRNNTLLLARIPNPYPMPESPYSLDFQNPGPFLNSNEVQRFLTSVFVDVVNHIQTHGDGPLPIWWGDTHCYNFYQRPYEFRMVTFENVFTYNDTTHILAAFILKSRVDGSRERSADVFNTVTGLFHGRATLTSDDALVNASRNNTLQLGPVPNPYVLSNSDLSIDFEEPMSELVPNDVVNCIVSARQRITHRISKSGEAQITIPLWFSWRSVEFRVFAEQVPRVVTLTDTLAILDAFAIKSGVEGFRSRWANIIVTEGAQIVGQAVLAHVPPVAGEAGNRTTSLESYRRARRRVLT
ncbi:MAG: hypothetical protein Q9195_007347 [Heterodermia aff. obscurata]